MQVSLSQAKFDHLRENINLEHIFQCWNISVYLTYAQGQNPPNPTTESDGSV
jgi:hypothetical protein